MSKPCSYSSSNSCISFPAAFASYIVTVQKGRLGSSTTLRGFEKGCHREAERLLPAPSGRTRGACRRARIGGAGLARSGPRAAGIAGGGSRSPRSLRLFQQQPSKSKAAGSRIGQISLFLSLGSPRRTMRMLPLTSHTDTSARLHSAPADGSGTAAGVGRRSKRLQ